MSYKRKIAALAAAGTGAIVALRAIRHSRRIDFQDRSVVITGGSRGLGLVMARRLAGEGARLSLLARDEAELERATHEFEAMGVTVLPVVCDVRDADSVQQAIARVVGHYGAIDVLINNAGIIQVAPFEHMQTEDYEDALRTHFWGPLYTTQAVLPYMKRQGSGRVVNISSIGGKISLPHMMPYSVSKFALVGFSDGLRAELAKDNIYVTTVCPFAMRTGSHINAFFKGQNEKEFTLFALFGAIPTNSVDARRAARQIIEACRYGDPSLIISWRARAAVVLSTLFPNLRAEAFSLGVRALPGPTDVQGDTLNTGWDSRSTLAPSLLTTLADKATIENNGLRGHQANELQPQGEIK